LAHTDDFAIGPSASSPDGFLDRFQWIRSQRTVE
jgi:hypothetical protein